MRKTAVVVCPGRGTYNRAELGYLLRLHEDRKDLVKSFDRRRLELGQTAISDLDQSQRFSSQQHSLSENSSPLIFASSYADYLAINSDIFDIVAVTGNSMGWYTTLACAGAVSVQDGFEIVNTMGTLMQEGGKGGQLVYPLLDKEWQAIPGQRDLVKQWLEEICDHPENTIEVSIEFGGFLVLAGNEAGLRAFETRAPSIGDKFPMRLRNHAAFHTKLVEPVAAIAKQRLDQNIFKSALLPMIDGRGRIWYPKTYDAAELFEYTLGHQVTDMYDFTLAIQVAAREFSPEAFIITGPGNTLGTSVAQSLIEFRWGAVSSKKSFEDKQKQDPYLLSMGDMSERVRVTGYE